jgi:hypothetical protein
MRVTVASFLAIAACGSLLAGCPDRTISEVNPQQGRVEYKEIPVTLNRNVDILFVIDDSPSMLDKQLNIKNNFPKFIEVLNTIQGGLPDVHIGVVSSDMGTKGSQDSAAGPAVGQIGQGGCSGTGKNGNLQTGQAAADLNGSVFISDIKQTDGTRNKNYTGDLSTVFGKLASLGAGGCGFEQHLLAMRRALENNPANASFLRPDAFLAVIFLADEDDCTFSKSTLLGPDSPSLGALQSFRCNRFGHTCAIGGRTEAEMNTVGMKDQCGPNEMSQYLEKVATFSEFLKGLKSDPNKVIVAGIMGIPKMDEPKPYEVELRAPPGGGSPIPSIAHSCSYQGAAGLEVADPPTRLEAFLNQFPNRNTVTTICQQDLSGGLRLIAQLLKSVIGDPCIEGKLADVDPNTPGDQFDCSVSDVTNARKPTQKEQILPACNESASNKPCWRIATDTMNCTRAPFYTLKIERSEAPPPETIVFANCVTDAVEAEM